MEAIYSYSIYIPILLFAAFLINGLGQSRIAPKLAGIISTTAIGASLVISCLIAFKYFLVNGPVDGLYPKLDVFSMRWLTFTDTLYIDMSVFLDPISIMMLIVISFVSFLVHLYSFGYMQGESGFARYFAFLSLFSFSMIGLVIAGNIFQMYIFWELVGLSSYLLIGFYYDKPSAVSASKKAFIVTRFADFGFLIGILLLSYFGGSFDFNILTDPQGPAIMNGSAVAFIGASGITWALALIFIGGAGKSAMFPLHIWLPDAMEGPTPVSALIHAATMVVAGVFMVARLFPTYYFGSPIVLEIIAIVGAFTSLFAAIIAITQTDIKRVLAYSTMSQIGYMMLALGVSGYGGENGLGYTASMFHLFTHAMFKALLFLAAGAIIHAVHSNDMKNMGGLRKYLPVTHITFLVAALAISGIPPFAGFFSKDEILTAAMNKHFAYYAVASLVAFLTAFYMFRLYFNIFWAEKKEYLHIHKPDSTMKLPLILLALESAFVGFIPFSHYVSSDLISYDTHLHLNVAVISSVIALLGITLAAYLYMKPKQSDQKISAGMPSFYTTVYHKFYIDEIYLWITRTIIFRGLASAANWFDHHIIDGTLNGIARGSNDVSESIKGMQSGQLQKYGMYMLAGVLGLFLLILYIVF